MSVAAPPQRRTRTLLVLTLVTLLGGLVTAYGVQSSSSTRQVWAAGRDLPAGHMVSKADLRVVEVNSGVRGIDDSSLVSGKALRGPVPEGTLINEGMVSSAPGLQKGMVEVPVPVKAGQKPLGLAPGEHVLLVQTTTGGGAKDTAAPAQLSARVLQVGPTDPTSGLGVVGLEVEAKDAARAAQFGAPGQATIVRSGAGQ